MYRRSGGWAFRIDVAPDPGSSQRQQISRQGFRTKTQSTAAMHEVAAETEPPRIVRADPLSVRQVSLSWLDRKATDCATSTLRTWLADAASGLWSDALLDRDRGVLAPLIGSRRIRSATWEPNNQR